MTNLTISVDAEVLKRARIKALENGESVNAYLARKLEEYAGELDREQIERQHTAAQKILELARSSHASSGPEGRTWTREDLYDR